MGVSRMRRHTRYVRKSRLSGCYTLKKGRWAGVHRPYGLIYKNDRPIFEDYLGMTGKVPLAKEKIDPLQFDSLVDEFK